MRIDKIRLSGFTTYKDEQTLDLAALGAGIIAVAGPNGSGKTTLLEAIPGAIYRQTPSRGNIAALATARDARIELTGENGAPFTIRLDADCQNGKQEAVIIDAAGEPLAGPKVRDFDKYVADHFPPLDVYLASFFASQTGVGSVLKMARSDRRALFGRLLGLERLELMATSARERARASESEMTAARAALEAIRSGAGDIAALEASLKTFAENEVKAAADVEETEKKVGEAQALRDKIEFAVRDAERATKAADDARRRSEDTCRKAEMAAAAETDLRRKLEALDEIIKQAPAIRAHAAKIKEIEAEINEIRNAGERASLTRDQALEEANRKGRGVEVAASTLKEAVRIQADSIARSTEAEKRRTAAEEATKTVPCSGALEDAVRSACPALVGHFRNRAEAQATIDAQAQRKDQLEAEVLAAVEDKAKAATEYAAAKEIFDRAGAEVARLRDKYKEFHERAEGLKASDKSAALDKAEAEASILRPAIESAAQTSTAAAAEYETAKAEAKKLEAAAVAVDYNELANADESLALAKEGLEKARQAAKDAAGWVITAEVQLKASREAQAKATALQEKLAPMEKDLADWRWLGRGLGREGVQALELDAAGPRVSGLANELLADAYGSRFQIRFETQAAKADGHGVKETFDVVVVDTERGREGNGEDLSGGEKVIVGEALGLAVGLFHAQAAGVSLGTVIRDETVGALDPENGERYLAMLRAFLRVGHVHQLLYVAHNPALVDMADAVIRVEDGRIEVK